MAFAFFRKRQKFVIVVMVLLMIAFLLPSALQQLGGGGGEFTIGRTASGRTLTVMDRERASSDLDILRRMGLGNYMSMQFGEMLLAYLTITRGEEEGGGFSYALLLAEAEDAGIEVTEADVDSLFQLAGLTGDRYQNFISTFRSESRMSEIEVRAVAARWMRVYKHFQEGRMNIPPSDAELRIVFRDLYEGINLRMVALQAKDYAPNEGAPDEQQIEAMFEQYKAQGPGAAEALDAWGFGYKQPTRIRMAYLLVREDVVARAVRPSSLRVQRYWLDHEDQFVQERSDAADTQPAETERSSMTFAEAEPLIVDLLRKEAVGPRIDDVLSLVAGEVRAVTAAPGASPYEQVVSSMRLPADRLLEREIRTVTIEAETLPRAMELLAEAAKGVRAIVYPWGEHGEIDLDPATRVTLKATDITLGEALRRITEQVKLPAIEWAMCKGFPGVLFPVGGPAGVDLFPLLAGDTGPRSFAEAMDDPVLGRATTSRGGRGEPLGRLLPELVERDEEGKAVLPIGRDGPRLYASGENAGGLLWRVLAFVPAHTPPEITPAIREQIIRDWRRMRGLAAAREKGRTLAIAATHTGLTQAAENLELESTETGMMTRRFPMQTRTGTWALVWTGIGEVSMPPALREAATRRAFRMAPDDVNDSPEKSSVEVEEMPALETVFVWRRVGYQPALAEEYEQNGKRGLLELDRTIREHRDRVLWFAPENIEKRVGFEPRKP